MNTAWKRRRWTSPEGSWDSMAAIIALGRRSPRSGWSKMRAIRTREVGDEAVFDAIVCVLGVKVSGLDDVSYGGDDVFGKFL